MHGTQRPWQSVSIKEIHSESGLPRPCWVDGPGRCCWRQRGHGVILRPAAEERSRPSPVGESGAVENRDRDVDRADVSPSSAASPVRSFDTCRVRSNYWVTCSRSVTPELSPLLASVPLEGRQGCRTRPYRVRCATWHLVLAPGLFRRAARGRGRGCWRRGG